MTVLVIANEGPRTKFRGISKYRLRNICAMTVSRHPEALAEGPQNRGILATLRCFASAQHDRIRHAEALAEESHC